MNRNHVLVIGVALLVISVGFVSAVWVETSGFNSDQSTNSVETVTDAPEEVENVRPLASAFYERITEYYPEARVFITTDGQIVMEFSPEADSGEGVQREMMQIAMEYTAEVNETGYDAVTLSIVTGQVEAVVPEPTAQEHASGNLTDEAFTETIEVRSVATETES